MSALHTEEHPLAGKSVFLAGGAFAGAEFFVEDWWDRVAGKSWMDCIGNPACLEYAVSSVGDPLNNEVVYGKIRGLGKFVHAAHLSVSVAA